MSSRQRLRTGAVAAERREPPPAAAGRPAGAAAPARWRAEGRVALVFLLPLVAIFSAFYLWPALNTIASSLFRWGLLNPWKATAPSRWRFVGLHNYAQVLTDGRFWNDALNTAVWLLLFPLLVTVASLALSLLLWHVRRGQAAFRTVFILPMTISLTAAGVIWTLVYSPDAGSLTALVRWLHLDGRIDWGPLHFQAAQWLSDPGFLDLGFARLRLANVSLIVPAFWAFTGFGVVTLTAGLSAVSDELVDAARVDGAGVMQVVRHVLVPALRGPLAIVLAVSVIFGLRTFDIVWVMTKGGPGQDTEVLAVLLWKQAFSFLDSPQAGVATALAVLLSAAMVALAIPYSRGLLRGGDR
jgi:ABC-type sugar transport system permease subunit